MFTNSPRYTRLAQQVAQAIEEGIRSGTWRETLPGERNLADALQVSRRTIRAAVELLRKQKLVQTAHGLGTQILPGPGKSPGPLLPLREIGLLLPDSIDHLRPHTAAFIDILRTIFYENGFRLETHVGHRFFSGRPHAALTKLTTQFRHSGWILMYSTRASQEWFRARNIPVVIVGTAHEGVDLPFVDIDMQATCRHGAGVLLRKGHQRIVLLIEESGRAGDEQSQVGFLDGARKFGGAETVAQVFKHSGEVESIARLVNRILLAPKAPTGWLIANPCYYLAVMSILASRGVRVPQDISLLSRDDDIFLSYLFTKPNRYECSSETRAKAAFSAVMKTLNGSSAADASTVLMPKYVEGASVIAPTRRGGTMK